MEEVAAEEADVAAKEEDLAAEEAELEPLLHEQSLAEAGGGWRRLAERTFFIRTTTDEL